jgi:hypothetical protein
MEVAECINNRRCKAQPLVPSPAAQDDNFEVGSADKFVEISNNRRGKPQTSNFKHSVPSPAAQDDNFEVGSTDKFVEISNNRRGKPQTSNFKPQTNSNHILISAPIESN